MDCFENDIDILAGLLDGEELPETVTNQDEPFSNTINNTQKQNDRKNEDLEEQLRQMQERMKLLEKQLEEQKASKLKNVDIFENTQSSSLVEKSISSAPSNKNDFFPSCSESSEDEEGGSSYNQHGKWVKKRLAHLEASSSSSTDRLKSKERPIGWKTKESSALVNLSKHHSQDKATTDNSFTDSGTGIRIINPRVSSDTLRELTESRRVIKLSQIKFAMRNGDIEGDWVTMAVLVSKVDPRTSQNGKVYSIWKLSDLKDCSKTIALFLFGEVHKTHWKMAIGSVVGLLNCSFFKDRQGSQDEVTMTIDHPQKILHVGSSKDLGWCRGTRKDGSHCTAFVNKSECEFCVYHVQSEFKKTSSKRSEIQSSFSGSGVSNGKKTSLQQKVLGKQEVFYGGKIFGGKLPPPTNSSVKGKDKKILDSLKLQRQADLLKAQEEEAANKSKSTLNDLLRAPTAGSRNLLQVIKGQPATVTPAPPVKSVTAKDLLLQHQQQMKILLQKPVLGKGVANKNQEISLDITPATKKPTASLSLAKLKAIQVLKSKGPLEASDPNKPLSSGLGTVKRKVPVAEDEPQPKKKLREDLEAVINAKSSHSDLLDTHDLEQQEIYFNKLEKKEQLENKMLSTYEVKTTAVVCPLCKYTALSASELCRTKGHPLKTIKTMKRFFKCKGCQNRTISLDRLPKRPCQNCGGTNWERAAMGRERKGPELPQEKLSLRGDEIRFVGDLRASSMSLDS